jgi:hypothetical protein
MGPPRSVRPIPGSTGPLGWSHLVVFHWVAALWALWSIPRAWLDLVSEMGPLIHVKSMWRPLIRR